MKVSVIIPTYNCSGFVAEAIRSVQAQTFTDLEILVIDDGSTDSTSEVLASIHEPRMKVFRTENRGHGSARNEGLAHAQGEFIAFLDADDRWKPAKLEKQMAIMESEPDVGMIFTDFVRFGESGFLNRTQFSFFPELPRVPTTATKCGIGRRITVDPFLSLIGFSMFPAWVQTMLFRAKQVCGIDFPTHRSVAVDLHYCLKVYQQVNVAYIDEPLVEVRRHGANMTTNIHVLEHSVRQVLCDLEKECVNPAHSVALRRRVGRAWVDSGILYLSQSKPSLALAAFTRALRYPGSRKRALKYLVAFPLLLAKSQSRSKGVS